MRECAGWRDALDLQSKEHIALVGGGGKTTTLWSLAHELHPQRLTVVTSTTKAGPPESDVPLVLWHEGMEEANLAKALRDASQRSQLLALGNTSRTDRIQSVGPAALDFVFTRLQANVINEADGARMKPFKAPAMHEPVLASSTTLGLIVMGADAIGASIDADHLHRPELIEQMTGAKAGDALTPAHIVAIVRRYIERMSEQAPEARYAMLINKAEGAPGMSVRDLSISLANSGLAAVVAASQSSALKCWRFD